MIHQHKRPAMVYLRHPTDTAAAASGAGKPAPSKDHIPRGLEYIPSGEIDTIPSGAIVVGHYARPIFPVVWSLSNPPGDVC